MSHLQLDETQKVTETTSFVFKDHDGIRYLDILSPGLLHDYGVWMREDVKLDMANLRDKLKMRVHSNQDARVRTKYEWLLKFVNHPRPSQPLSSA